MLLRLLLCGCAYCVAMLRSTSRASVDGVLKAPVISLLLGRRSLRGVNMCSCICNDNFPHGVTIDISLKISLDVLLV